MAVTQIDFPDSPVEGEETFLSRLGIPQPLAWGFLGLLLFMIGDGVESGYLSPFLAERGISQTSVAWIFTTYGLAVGVAGWLSGALSDVWGPRRVILTGLSSWVFFEILFLTIGLRSGNTFLILVTYGLRGLGYPLFAFGFLVWITVVAPQQRLASAMGWFWFAFTGGLPTLGSVVASYCIPKIGAYSTLWLSAVLVSLGGLILLLGVKEPRGRSRLVPVQEKPLHALLDSIALAWRKPKTGIACIVRVINTAPEFGFFVFLPTFFTKVIGFTMQAWLLLLSAIFLSNIIWNLLFGLIGDRFGWRRTVTIFGGFGCTITTLGLYYVPSLSHSFHLTLVAGVLYGATLAGYVPLSALMPSLAPKHRGASLSLLSLGAGASVWVGPALVGLLLKPLGIAGLMWVFSMLYLLSGFLALTLRLPHEEAVAERTS
ncbi:MAG TPA: MFS transporter [Edaphobacter sp.]|jgi:polyol permease family